MALFPGKASVRHELWQEFFVFLAADFNFDQGRASDDIAICRDAVARDHRVAVDSRKVGKLDQNGSDQPVDVIAANLEKHVSHPFDVTYHIVDCSEIKVVRKRDVKNGAELVSIYELWSLEQRIVK